MRATVSTTNSPTPQNTSQILPLSWERKDDPSSGVAVPDGVAVADGVGVAVGAMVSVVPGETSGVWSGGRSSTVGVSVWGGTANAVASAPTSTETWVGPTWGG